MENALRSAAKPRRSRAGCSQCRRLRIKCDEQYPTCQECTKRDRVCNLSESRFRSFEPQSHTGSGSARSHVHDGRYSVQSRRHRLKPLSNTAASQILSQDDSHARGSSADSGTPESRASLDYNHQDSALTENMSVMSSNIQPDTLSQLSQPSYSLSFEEGLPRRILHYPVDATSVSTNEATPPSAASANTHHDMMIRCGVETTEERAFFLRHFSNTPGRWMDLFDQQCFYSRQVPVLALYSPLIMFSACAFAARQLSLTSKRPQPPNLPQSHTKLYAAGTQKRDYMWFAEAYYDAAITLLRQLTSDVAGRNSVSLPTQDPNAPTEPCFDGHSPGLTQDIFPHARLHDEIVVAVTILSNYEFLGGAAPNWLDHLNGARSFLRLSDEAGFLDFAPPSPVPGPSSGPSPLLLPAFWNFVRQDMLSALIHRQKTRLEMHDYAMWRRMGLNLSPDGGVADRAAGPQFGHFADRIDIISNTLIWLLAKLVNFIATCSDEADTEPYSTMSNASSESNSFLDGWLSLKNEFQLWFDTLPPFFQPCSRVKRPNRSSSNRQSCHCRSKPLIDHETWYSDSMCASSMQSYHMSQIILLLHKPRTISVRQLPWTSKTQPASRRFPDTLADFNQMNEMLQHHAVEICAIALSRPEEAARIHMLQPLYLAGRCLTDVSDRRMVVSLIDGIEDELGWHAKYRVEALLAEWDTNRDTLRCCDGG